MLGKWPIRLNYNVPRSVFDVKNIWREEGVELFVEIQVFQVVLMNQVEHAVQSQQTDGASHVIRFHEEVSQQERLCQMGHHSLV